MKSVRLFAVILVLLAALLPAVFLRSALAAPTVGQVRAQCEAAARHDAIYIMMQQQQGVPVGTVVADFTAAAAQAQTPEVLRNAVLKMIRAIYAADNAAAKAAYNDIIESCTVLFAPKVKA